MSAPTADGASPLGSGRTPLALGSGRTPRRRGGGAGVVGVALVLVLAGWLFAANARLQGGLHARDAQDLPGLVQAEMDRTETLVSEVEELRDDVDRLATEAGGAPSADPEQTQLLAQIAGRVAVAGEGLTIRLTDAPANAPRPEWVVNDDLVVHQQDLQAVINALWAGGAEAMTLQGERVISTSAFRCVGNVLFLHGKHFSPPYVVRAVGDPDTMRGALYSSDAISDYLDYVEHVGLGWSETQERELNLPAYEGGMELQHARLPDGVDPLGT